MKKKFKMIYFYGLLVFFLFVFSVTCSVTVSSKSKFKKPKSQSTSKVKINSIENSDDVLKVHFINVGFGDAMLIVQGDDAMMVDYGRGAIKTYLYKYIKRQNVKSLRYAILTHPHVDHMGGMLYQLKRLDVKSVLCTKDTYPDNFYEETMDYICKENIPVVHPKVGTTYKLGKAKFKVMGPLRWNYDRLNDKSLVIKLTYGSTSFLLVGDQEIVAEADMVCRYGTKLHADVLKVGHHGSFNASSDEFLKYVHPTYGVISAGNYKGHVFPNQDTLGRLSAHNIKLYRTDQDGSIVAISNGKKIVWQKGKKFGKKGQSLIKTVWQKRTKLGK